MCFSLLFDGRLLGIESCGDGLPQASLSMTRRRAALMASSVSSMSFVRAATVASSTSAIVACVAPFTGFSPVGVPGACAELWVRVPLAGRYWRFLVQQCFAPPIRRRRARASCALLATSIGYFRSSLRVLQWQCGSGAVWPQRDGASLPEPEIESLCAANAGPRIVQPGR